MVTPVRCIGLIALALAGGCVVEPAPLDPTPAPAAPADEEVEDPPFEVNALTFGMGVEAATELVREKSNPVSAELQVSYWRDIQNQVLECVQRLRITGIARPPNPSVPDDCPQCEWIIELDPETVEDVSEPGIPGDCDPDELTEAEADWGHRLLTPIPEGFGDFLQLAWLDLAAAEQLDLANWPQPWPPGSKEYAPSHVGLVRSIEGSLADGAGLDGLFGDNLPDDWLPYWDIHRSTEAAADTFILAAFFLINFQPQ